MLSRHSFRGKWLWVSHQATALLVGPSPETMHASRGFLQRVLGAGRFHAKGTGARSRFQQKAFLRVEATQTPNPDALKFVLLEDRSLFPQKTPPVSISRKRAAEAKGQLPLELAAMVSSILAVEQIEGVLLCDEFLTVTKTSDAEWDDISTQLLQVLEKASLPPLLSGEEGSFPLPGLGLPPVPTLSMQQKSAEPISPPLGLADEDGGVEQEIKELLEEKVRPYIHADGGDIHFVRFDRASGVVHLAMLGACASCASSTVTLKFMVRNLLVHYFEGQVRDVESVDLESDDCLLGGGGVGKEG